MSDVDFWLSSKSFVANLSEHTHVSNAFVERNETEENA